MSFELNTLPDSLLWVESISIGEDLPVLRYASGKVIVFNPKRILVAELLWQNRFNLL